MYLTPAQLSVIESLATNCAFGDSSAAPFEGIKNGNMSSKRRSASHTYAILRHLDHEGLIQIFYVYDFGEGTHTVRHWEYCLTPKGVRVLCRHLSDRGDAHASAQFYRRIIGHYDRARETEHPSLVGLLRKYSHLLRELGRTSEAEKTEARAKAIEATKAVRLRIPRVMAQKLDEVSRWSGRSSSKAAAEALEAYLERFFVQDGVVSMRRARRGRPSAA